MQPNTQHADRAHHAAQRTPHEPAPKPRSSIAAPSRHVGRTAAARFAGGAEGQLIRLVARLSVDAKGDSAARAAHGYFVNGYLAALEALNVLPASRLLTIRQTCNVLLDGDITLQDLRAMKPNGNDTDPTYLRAVSLVRRAGAADVDRLARELSTTPAAARALIDRMQADGVTNPPDLFGVRTLKSQMEVSHG